MIMSSLPGERMPSRVETPRERAPAGLVGSDRMHRELTIPATATHEALTVSYADVGRPPAGPPAPGGGPGTDDGPTVLFVPGMFASRYIGVYLHAVAEELGVRVLVVDRPGMGRSTDVALERRISVWVELVPRLLQHLGIRHVSLVSHSAGTMYLFNTLHHCRDVLHPERPFVALLAPWVDLSHSRVKYMQAAQLLPVGAFGVWHLLPKFFAVHAGPAFASSGTFFTRLGSAISPQQQGEGEGEGQREEGDENAKRLERDYGLGPDALGALRGATTRSMFAESTVGANSEALLCLRKGPGADWGCCGDYGAFVRQLAASEGERRAGAVNADRSPARLKVRAYFAESDALTGTKGQEYVARCFESQIDGPWVEAIDFAATTVPGTNHDSVIDHVATLEEIFVQAGGQLRTPRE